MDYSETHELLFNYERQSKKDVTDQTSNFSFGDERVRGEKGLIFFSG